MNTYNAYNAYNEFGNNNRADDLEREIAQSALHATNLAMARWSRGITCSNMQLAQALQTTSQARWYAQADANLQSWIADGGFGQGEEAEGDAITA